MPENSKTSFGLVNLELPKSLDNALTNITDSTTKQIGSTFGDIWFLVFGSIGHLAEKRKMKYALALKEYEDELRKKINSIPVENRIEADTQIVAPALEASKYCIEKEELREMFANLIASSMNSEKEAIVHPIFTDIIKRLSYVDAQLLKTVSLDELTDNNIPSHDHIIFSVTIEMLSFSIAVLKNLGLIEYRDLNSKRSTKNFNNRKTEVSTNNVLNDKYHDKFTVYYNYDKHFESNSSIIFNNSLLNYTYEFILEQLTELMNKRDCSGNKFTVNNAIVEYFVKAIQLTPLGQRFKSICLDA